SKRFFSLLSGRGLVGSARLAPIGEPPQDHPYARSGEGSMKHIDPRLAGALAAVVSVSACVIPPAAPTIPVAPGPNKSFEAFSADQAGCQQYATAQTAPQAYAANNQAVGTAL